MERKCRFGTHAQKRSPMEAPRIQVLIGLLTPAGRLIRCVLVSEEDLPMPWPYVVIARDPHDVRDSRKGLPK